MEASRIFCEQSGVGHAFEIVAKGGERCACWDQREAAADGVVIVDRGASDIFLGVEPGFVRGDQGRDGVVVKDGLLRVAVNLRQVVPMSGEPFATQAGLQAVHMRGRGLFPEGAGEAHDQRRGGWEFELALQRVNACQIARHGHDRVRLSGGACAEFKEDGRLYVSAIAGVESAWIAQQYFVVALACAGLRLDLCGELLRRQRALKHGDEFGFDPLGQQNIDACAPFLFLAGRGGDDS